MTRAFLCLSMLASFSLTGCEPSRPDPRANPNFNEAAMTDPSKVNMDAIKIQKKK